MNYENFESKEQLLRRRRSKLDRSICAIALAAERISAVSALHIFERIPKCEDGFLVLAYKLLIRRPKLQDAGFQLKSTLKGGKDEITLKRTHRSTIPWYKVLLNRHDLLNTSKRREVL